MGVDPSRLFLFPEPPLLSDTSFEPLSLDGLVYLASPSPEQQRRSEGGGHHGSQGGGASSQGGGLVPRRLSVNEVFNRLEKKALSSSLRFGRRRPLPRATSVFPAVLSSGPQGSRHRVFHLAVLPRHYSLCTRVIEPQLLTPTQQQKMKQLLFVPSTSSSQQQQQQVSAVGRKTSGAGETNSAPMVSIENEPVFHFVTLVLNRRVESIGCVEGLIASRCPLSGRPATVQDLIAAALVRMDKSLKSQLAQEITRAQSGQSAGGAGGGELFSSPDAMWTAAEGAGGGGGGGSQQQQALEASDADLASALRVVLASAAAVQPLERSQQLQSLPFYTSNTTGGAGRQQQGRGPSGTGGAGAGAGEHVAATQNLLAMPLRLELDWTVEEKDQLVKGTLKVRPQRFRTCKRDERLQNLLFVLLLHASSCCLFQLLRVMRRSLRSASRQDELSWRKVPAARTGGEVRRPEQRIVEGRSRWGATFISDELGVTVRFMACRCRGGVSVGGCLDEAIGMCVRSSCLVSLRVHFVFCYLFVWDWLGTTDQKRRSTVPVPAVTTARLSWMGVSV